MGHEPGRLEIPILQFVHIVEGGEKAKMSKRRGDFVTLDELIDAVGVDAIRWFMLSRSHESTIDLDLALARRQDPENPVYYVQYAHARIASILRRADVAEMAHDTTGAELNAVRARARAPPAVVPERGPRGDGAARAA